jgi:hypothetical protein
MFPAAGLAFGGQPGIPSDLCKDRGWIDNARRGRGAFARADQPTVRGCGILETTASKRTTQGLARSKQPGMTFNRSPNNQTRRPA